MNFLLILKASILWLKVREPSYSKVLPLSLTLLSFGVLYGELIVCHFFSCRVVEVSSAIMYSSSSNWSAFFLTSVWNQLSILFTVRISSNEINQKSLNVRFSKYVVKSLETETFSEELH